MCISTQCNESLLRDSVAKGQCLSIIKFCHTKKIWTKCSVSLTIKYIYKIQKGFLVLQPEGSPELF